jgi:hypothetical protein
VETLNGFYPEMEPGMRAEAAPVNAVLRFACMVEGALVDVREIGWTSCRARLGVCRASVMFRRIWREQQCAYPTGRIRVLRGRY